MQNKCFPKEWENKLTGFLYIITIKWFTETKTGWRRWERIAQEEILFLWTDMFTLLRAKVRGAYFTQPNVFHIHTCFANTKISSFYIIFENSMIYNYHLFLITHLLIGSLDTSIPGAMMNHTEINRTIWLSLPDPNFNPFRSRPSKSWNCWTDKKVLFLVFQEFHQFPLIRNLCNMTYIRNLNRLSHNWLNSHRNRE